MLPHISPYILLNGIGLIVALFLVDDRLRCWVPDRQDCAYVLLVFAVVAGWVGAHVLDWLVSSQPFTTAGFTFYGGLLTAVAFFIGTGRPLMNPIQLKRALNAAVLPLVVAHGIGRIGCFMAGCCYGHFIAGTTVRHPTQLYESAFLFLFAIVLVRRRSDTDFEHIIAYLLAYPTFRFFVEFLRADDRGNAFGLSTSQWISIVLLCFGWFFFRSSKGANKALQATAGSNSS